MAIKQKIGKTRLDKYYFMAKDHGYRARSAFKLIQINQSHNILSGVHSVVDLCAAPGGWLQVVSKAVRPPSKVIGVDLDPIKAIFGVDTLIGDITDEMCKTEILNRVGDTEVDLVLHDGAPNVGASWERDAYAQNELVCHAAKLACQILKKNGTFVTKVFRSKDFNALVWMCSQLFTECLTTKPRSSREESAEVFLVCRGYRKPAELDERFFDPQFVFAEAAEVSPGANTLSALLEGRVNLNDCTKIEIDCMSHMIDEETRILLGDLQLVSDFEKKKLGRVIKKIARVWIARRGGNSPEEVVDTRTRAERQRDEELEIRKRAIRRAKVSERRVLARRAKRLGLTEQDITEIEKVHGDFFEDAIFDDEEESSTEEVKPRYREVNSDEKGEDAMEVENEMEVGDGVEDDSDIEEEDEDEEEEVNDFEVPEEGRDDYDDQNDSDADSCSSSLDLEDKVCGYRLREDEEEFENDGIDRYVYDDGDDENLPQFFKDDEAKYNRRFVFNEDREDLEEKVTLSKKNLELKARQNRRVDRKIQKIKDRMDDKEQDVDLRAVRKGAMKKQKRERKQMIFSGPARTIPHIQGRIKMTDRRMKKDKAGLKRAEERKARGRR
ncbi:AdoMet-dependent rRNA methyltransferase SPB1 [Nematocida homosporus]|uniref:AdoMet-dependent rRNA methyltransferase SPB1 n=1 Tax=Nematocida homosporus TaxID=1912981 RepID=UPI0022200547|nr:AdoMet-dependent rRNA methyltransferase SPB1 [Nematocida homosporus]KAI5185398.1 AdoMet-dependent rRNA methyltransferase SPB1 [Nematocida homosporus]